MTFQAYSLNFILVDIERLGLYISNVFIIYVQSVLSKKNYNNNQYNIDSFYFTTILHHFQQTKP